MMRLGVLGLILLASIGLGGCAEDEVEQRTTLRSCDGNRETTLHVARDLVGATRAIPLGNHGYLLFARGIFGSGLLRLDANGELLEQIPNPSAQVPVIMDAAGLADGSLLVAGVIQDLSSYDPLTGAWVGRLDADGTMVWELEVGPHPAQTVAVRALPDGGAIVAGLGSAGPVPLDDSDQDADTPNGVVSWMRISDTGDVLWERSAEMDGPITGGTAWPGAKLLTLGPQQTINLVVQTLAGLVLITSDWDGETHQENLLATRLAAGLVGSEVLPDGRLAILSNRAAAVLTMVDREGSVLWEQSHGRLQGAYAEAIAYDATRKELLVGGSVRGDDLGDPRTWIVGHDLEGIELWSITREPLGLGAGENIEHVSPSQGPDVTDLAIAPNGRFLAPGSSIFDLSYFIVDPEGCRD